MKEKTLLAKLLIQAIKLGSIEGEKALFSALRKHYVVQKESSNPKNIQMFNTPALKAIDVYRSYSIDNNTYIPSGRIQWIKLFKSLTQCGLYEAKKECDRRFPLAG